jgi:hypothetical protein
MRTEVALARKKLQVAGVPDKDLDMLLPKPARNSSEGNRLSLEQIEVRCQVGLNRKKLRDKSPRHGSGDSSPFAYEHRWGGAELRLSVQSGTDWGARPTGHRSLTTARRRYLRRRN